MPTVKNQVPYEIACVAADTQSSKAVTNLMYVRNAAPTASLAYGADIPGSLMSTVVTDFKNAWVTLIGTLLSVNYQLIAFVMRSIVGKTFSTPVRPISALVPGEPVTIVTGVNHGLNTGQQVQISGVTAPSGVNAIWSIVKIDNITFTLTGSSLATAWSGDGNWQPATGTVKLLYGDLEALSDVSSGGVTGDAMSLFVTASARRLNAGVGRKFRSRVSFSPLGESDCIDGRLVNASYTAFNTALAAFLVTAVQNGSTDATGKFMLPVMVSRLAASGLASPFTSSDSWCKYVSNMVVQPNTGSLVRRKPRLTQPIA